MHHLDAGPRDGPARRARRDSPLSEKLGSLSVCANEKKPRATGRILAPSESGQKAINFTTSHRMEMKMCVVLEWRGMPLFKDDDDGKPNF